MKKLAFLSIFLALPFFACAQGPGQSYLGPFGNIPVSLDGVAADTATLTTDQITSVLLTGTPTAAANYTTPTALSVCQVFLMDVANVRNRYVYDWYVKNTSAGSNAITIVAGAGGTITGTATIAQNAIKHFFVRVSGCGSGQTPALVVFSLGTSTF